MKIYHPWNNLGCAGIEIGKGLYRVYMDVFKRPSIGMFIRVEKLGKAWVWFRPFNIKLESPYIKRYTWCLKTWLRRKAKQ